MESIVRHLRAQADRYGRLAHDLEGSGQGGFLRTMAAGYRLQADRAVAAYKEPQR